MLILLKKRNIVKHTILLSHIKMGKEVLTFGDIEIKKRKNFTAIRLLFFGRCRYEEVLVFR